MSVKLLALLIMIILAASACSNVAASRGEPRRGQVTNSQWSAAPIVVLADPPLELDFQRAVRLKPGEHTPKGRRYAGFCIPAGFTGSARIATDDNPAGWPPVTVSGGSCRALEPRDVATVTVSR